MTSDITYPPIEELIPAHWTGETVEVNGIPVYYTRTGGDKPPLVLLHGFQMDGRTWLRVAKVLETEYDVIMPDARGHGRTGHADANFTTPMLVEDVAALIQALHLDTPIVMGHSMGADTAGRLALAYPTLVSKVILIDSALRLIKPSAWMESEGYQTWYREWLAYVEKLPSQSHNERIAASLARVAIGILPSQVEDYVTHIEALAHLDLAVLQPVKTMNDGIPSLMDVLVDAAETPKLLLLAQPTRSGYLAFDRTGERDELVNRWQNGEVIIFADTGHFIQGERLEEFIDTVRAWLQ